VLGEEASAVGSSAGSAVSEVLPQKIIHHFVQFQPIFLTTEAMTFLFLDLSHGESLLFAEILFFCCML